MSLRALPMKSNTKTSRHSPKRCARDSHTLLAERESSFRIRAREEDSKAPLHLACLVRRSFRTKATCPGPRRYAGAVAGNGGRSIVNPERYATCLLLQPPPGPRQKGANGGVKRLTTTLATSCGCRSN